MTDTQQPQRDVSLPRRRHSSPDANGASGRGRPGFVVALAAGVIGLEAWWAGSGLLGGGAPGGGTEQPGLADVEAARWEAQADHFEQLWGAPAVRASAAGRPGHGRVPRRRTRAVTYREVESMGDVSLDGQDLKALLESVRPLRHRRDESAGAWTRGHHQAGRAITRLRRR